MQQCVYNLGIMDYNEHFSLQSDKICLTEQNELKLTLLKIHFCHSSFHENCTFKAMYIVTKIHRDFCAVNTLRDTHLNEELGNGQVFITGRRDAHNISIFKSTDSLPSIHRYVCIMTRYRLCQCSVRYGP
jgi:hypothetical protein